MISIRANFDAFAPLGMCSLADETLEEYIMGKLPHEHAHKHAHNLDQIIRQSSQLGDFEQIADVFEKLSDARRVQIYWILCHCEECVTDIAAMVGMSSPAVSHHLRVLKECGLIESRREGREVIYKATDSELTHLLHVVTEEIMSVSCPEADIVPENFRHDTGVAHQHDKAASHHDHDCCHGHAHNHAREETPADPTDNAQVLPSSNLATEIHEYLNEHLDQHITIESLSKHFCVNPTTIKTVFRETFGNSVAAHTREHRMEKAAGLLKESSLSLAEIATAVGYHNQSKFTQAFKESYGVLPKDYRLSSKTPPHTVS